jgi:hypothetical protein
MKRIAIFVLLLCALLTATGIAASSETYFKFKITSPAELEKLTRVVSIDNVRGTDVFAYANDKQFSAFKTLGYEYEVLPRPSSLVVPRMTDSKDGMKAWDSYPTYNAYVTMMYQFQTDHPGICQVFSIGQTADGRDLLYARISDNVAVEEDEPEVLYTSSMHGDETTGYILCLRLIDSLLTAYGTDTRITNMVDSLEIFINPLANPDGTYAGGNSSVSGATRYNGNGVDINRNCPDPNAGQHPDGEVWQPETIHIMDFADNHSISISANFHGGAEVVNFPWDTWSKRHADNTWWIAISRCYADTVHAHSTSGYMTDLQNGITDGYDWYQVEGGRQDYMTWYHRGREVTIEISDTKLLPAAQLPTWWGYNRLSLLQWFENTYFGIRGVVTDAVNGDPVSATVSIPSFDSLNSQVWTDPDVGDYHRMIQPGTYTLVFTAPGYYPDTVTSVSVAGYRTTTRVDVQLQPLPNGPMLEFVSYQADVTNPGDTCNMGITLSNIGLGNATGVTGVLATTDSYVTVTQNTSAYPSIAAGGGTGTSSVTYEFAISEDCPMFHMVPFVLHLTDDDTYVDSVTFEMMVGDRVVFYLEDFSNNQGWTGLGGAGEWTIGPCIGGGTTYKDPTDDHSPSSDDQVLGNDLTSSGTYSNNLTTTYWAYSPTIDCSGRTGVQLSYWHWLGCESSQYDHAYFQVYNGTSWVQLFANGASSQETAWSQSTYDVSSYADNNPAFQMRWGIGSTDGSAQYSGWNIDDIEIKGYGSGGGSAHMVLTPAQVADSLQPGDNTVTTLRIRNTGDVSLGVWFSSTDAWLSFSADKQTVLAGDSADFPVMINTSGLLGGDHVGSIGYTSTDDDNPSGSIPVYLYVYIPEFSTATTDIDESLRPAENKTVPVIIDNKGAGRLLYSVAVQMNDKQPFAAAPEMLQPIAYREADPDKAPGVMAPYFDAIERGSGGPDTYGHMWTDSDQPGGPAYSWVDISAVGTAVTLSDDNFVGPLTIGFGFPFYDSTYTSFYIGSNGVITFDTGYGVAANLHMPNDSLPSAAIAMWHDDLDPPEAGHVYYYRDVAKSRLIVSFNNVRNYLYPTGTGDLSFQAILYANGKITLQYGTMNAGSDADGLNGATIGIQNSAATDGLSVVYNAAYMHANLAIDISASTWLSAAPLGGSIEPGMSATINALLDAEDLEVGAYTGSLTIATNDPVMPTYTIPVSLTVATSCCEQMGNLDRSADKLVTMSDLTVLIDNLFIALTPLACAAEGNLDLSADGLVTMSDLTVLIDNQFIMLTPLPSCP